MSSRPPVLDVLRPFTLPLILLLISRGLMWFWMPFASEDAYIAFRYARNLATGNGLVYNPEDHVFGFTSPLWTLWCAAGFTLGRDPVGWARSWSLAADVVSLLLITHLLERHATRMAAWSFALFFAIWPYCAAVTASGLEMSAVLMLIALAAFLAGRGSAGTGPVLGMLALSRPEGLAAAAWIAWRARPRDRWIAGGILAAGVVALWLYFGSPLPQSLTSKADVYGIPGPWRGRHWWDWLMPVVLGIGPSINDTAYLMLLRILMFPAAVLGIRELWRQPASGLASAAGAMLLVWAGYVVVGVSYFWWYLLVPLAGIVIAASVGLEQVVRGRLVLASLVLYLITLWTVAPSLYRNRALAESAAFGAVADYLQVQAAPGEAILLEPIGIIGYRLPLRVIDEIGLVSPAVSRRRRQGAGWYADIARSERPEWLVVRAGLLRTGEAFAGRGTPFRSFAERESLIAGYEHRVTVNLEAGDGALLVLRRR